MFTGAMSFVLQSLVLQIIGTINHLCFKSFVLQIICSTHYLSCRSFVLHSGENIVCPTNHLSFISFVLHTISPTEWKQNLSYISLNIYINICYILCILNRWIYLLRIKRH